MRGPFRIEGYAIACLDGAIADATGLMPDSLKLEADQRFFERALDRAAVVVHGRMSHEGQPNSPKRRRLLLTEGIALIVIQTTLRANASRTAAQAASRRRARLSDRLPTGRAAALSHRKSPDRPMCSQPTGEVWVSHSSGTSSPVARMCTTASAI